VLLALVLLLAGREVRHRLLVGPEGAWRDNLWLDELVEAPTAADPAEAPTGAAAPAGAPPGMPESTASTVTPGQATPAASARADSDPPRSRKGSRAALTAPLRINRCSPDSLQLLPGVGPVLAARIDEARRGGIIFRGPADLLAVKGIGPAALARLSPLVVFADPPGSPTRGHNPH
jgi:DNA uptake protein ComE-like DNA-binding protein